MEVTLEALKGLLEHKIGFVERMGLKVLDLSPGHVKLMVPLERNVNHVGGMYAGAMFTLAEIPGGALSLATFDPSKYYPVVKELTIRFLKPAETDLTFEASLAPEEVARLNSDLSSKSKADFVIEGVIKDTSENVVAQTRAVYQVRALERR
ncbi:MAG: YiiD C-terminal domain-containing protein [Pseudomonadota bacterium]